MCARSGLKVGDALASKRCATSFRPTYGGFMITMSHPPVATTSGAWNAGRKTREDAVARRDRRCELGTLLVAAGLPSRLSR